MPLSATRLPTFFLALGAVGCLEDPAPPLTCPPGAPQQRIDCDALDASPFVGECGLFPNVTCSLRRQCTTSIGDDPGCEGVERECPTPEPACFPTGDCPSLVRTEVGRVIGPQARASCGRIDEFFPPPPGREACWCGCKACASICDGRGPVLYGRRVPGAAPPDGGDGPPVAMLRTDVSSALPDEGFFGLYLSVRGEIDARVRVETKIPTVDAKVFEVRGDFDDFTEIVLFEQNGVYPWALVEVENNPEVGVLAEAFGTDFVKPHIVEILPGDGNTIAELDCILPFWSNR